MSTKSPSVDNNSPQTAAPESTPAQNGHAPDPQAGSQPARKSFGQVLRSLNWRLLLLTGLGAGVLWTVMLTRESALQFVAGLLPVTAGIVVGRRIRAHVNWHALFLSLFTIIGAAIAALLVTAVQGLTGQILAALSLGVITLIPFPAFGVIMSAQSMQRARAVQEEQARRGGRLERPGRVRTLEDLQALSLPQLGGYVADLFRKHGFVISDYQIEKDKDRIDFRVTHEQQPWLLRVTTVDKVKPGVAQELAQRMKVEGLSKGVVITSTEFQEAAIRWAKDKPVALVDGPTLLSMDD